MSIRSPPELFSKKEREDVKTLLKRIGTHFLILGTLVAMFLVNTTIADASRNTNTWGTGNLGSSEYGEIVNDETEISGEYSFIARWIDGVTTVSTFGGRWDSWSYSYGGATGILGYLPTNDNSKGKVGVTYHNVGMHNGRVIDLKITVTDWERGATNYGYIFYTTGAISHVQQSYRYVKQRWEFIDARTGQPVKLSGYMTITDIDFNQGVTFDKNTVPHLGTIYVTEDSNISVKKENDGSLTVYDPFRVNADPSDLWAQFTFLYRDTSFVEFDWNLKNLPSHMQIGEPNTNERGGEFFGFTGKKLARTATIEPEKYIQTDDGLVTSSVLESLHDSFVYLLIHKVPDELDEFYYRSYEIRDDLPAGLEVVNYRIVDQEGRDVSLFFDDYSTKDKIHFVAKPAVLKTDRFYDTDYRIEVEVKVKDVRYLEELIESDHVLFRNVVRVSVDDKPKVSEEVTTQLFRRRIVVDHIDKQTEELLRKVEEHKFDGESYSYEPFDDLEDDEGNRYKSTVNHLGVVNGRDLYFVIPYHIPLLEVNVESIQIDTSKAEKDGGLPARLVLVKEAEYQEDLSNLRFVIEIVEEATNRVVYEQELTVNDVDDVFELLLPTDAVEKAEKIDYLVTIKVVDNPDKNKFVTDTKDLATHGYTATEKVLTERDVTKGVVDYEAVVRTLRLREEVSVQEFSETIRFDFEPMVSSKTGYGFAIDLAPTFSSEVHDTVEAFDLRVRVPQELVDSQIHEVFVAKEKEVIIPLDQTWALARSGDSRTDSSFTYEFPEMRVEKITGNLFTANQMTRSNRELLDGGRNFYLPIWLDLSSYEVTIESDIVGKNHIQLEMTKTVDVFAYMYATMDSDTKELDELLLTPVFPETDAPRGWSDEEIAWLKGA
ncbi:hypothetical protein [Enterococcus sp. AZ012]|uniref:hypothetical protein n=1 Tax=unclassified Enterococcus TaxID=2608891 RepID=UPI003D2D7E8C